MNVFIDANVLLDFYRFSKSDLIELRKIARLSKKGEIRLLISDYLKDEVYRNRENEIARSIKAFEDMPTSWSVPKIFTAYADFSKLTRLLDELEKTKKALLASARKDVQESSHIADSVIAELFRSAEPHVLSEATLKLGVDRAIHSKKPGKRESCGDAVHWEWLKLTVPDKQDLTIISADSDFASPLPPYPLSAYLSDEWKENKSSRCTLFSSLAGFLKKHFPDIKISDEIEKEAVPRPTGAMWPLDDQMAAILNSAQRMDEALRKSPGLVSMQETFRALENNPVMRQMQETFRAIENSPLMRQMRQIEESRKKLK